MLYGVDVSHWNRIINPPQFGEYDFISNLHFIIAKATQGEKYRDNTFDANMALCNEYGILKGAYHFVDVSDPYKQAKNFVSYVRPYADCLLALDFEDSNGAMKVSQETINNYLFPVAKYVKDFTGAPPLIYASEYVFNSFDFSEVLALGCGLWVAKWDYRAKPTKVKTSGSSKIVAVKQWSNKGSCPFYSGSVDLDVANMSVEAWEKYANPRMA